jgi:hypothetical protein
MIKESYKMSLILNKEDKLLTGSRNFKILTLN